jgi:hypothetical protein
VPRLIFDHRTANHIAAPEKLEVLVDLIETDGFDRVPDSALLHEANDLA